MDAKPKRRWPRFSLRTLLVLVTIACAGFGWLGVKVRQAQRQEEAVEAIRKLGGIVNYDYEFDSNDEHVPSATPPNPVWLRKLTGDDYFANVVNVSLMFKDTQDAVLVHVQELTQLKFLTFCNTQVTDAGLVHLERLTQLKFLNLFDTEVTDAGLVHLEGLTQLEYLDLSGTKVTDAGLVHFKALSHLETLALYRTQVTDAGVQKLQRASPNLKIDR